MRVLFLDIDGVLNRTGFQPQDSGELRSWIEPELAARLTDVLKRAGAAVVMSSDWRLNRERDALAEELHAAGVEGFLRDVTPHLPGQPRWREIEAWLVEHAVAHEHIVIVDDRADMGQLQDRLVCTPALTGLDDDAAARILYLFHAR
jgi:HAD domain in Swiss Army Knife RNA repair proteins